MQITNAGEDAEKREPLYIVGGTQKGTAAVGNMEVSQKPKNRTVI